MALFGIALIALIVWAGARIFPSHAAPDDEALERPEELLDRRLARGEIDPETHDKLRDKLRIARAR